MCHCVNDTLFRDGRDAHERVSAGRQLWRGVRACLHSLWWWAKARGGCGWSLRWTHYSLWLRNLLTQHTLLWKDRLRCGSSPRNSLLQYMQGLTMFVWITTFLQWHFSYFLSFSASPSLMRKSAKLTFWPARFEQNRDTSTGLAVGSWEGNYTQNQRQELAVIVNSYVFFISLHSF